MEQIIQVPDNLKLIAVIIRKDWKKIYFGAEPYVNAMESLNKITDNYYSDTGDSIVRYFLGNAKSWRGPIAKSVKAKLNALLTSIK